MKKIFHKANSRGYANHGWLKSYHTFSFASYYDPERMNFGALRVLNDDTVSGGMGFGKHPHENMEIVSIPLSGDLEHEDSMGNKVVIKEGDVQIMTAGTGIIHGEKNKNPDKEVKFLQIWVIPKIKNVNPNYDQITLQPGNQKNKLQQIVSPNPDEDGVVINQDAWFYIADLDAGIELSYVPKGQNAGMYAFVLEGEITINDEKLNTRDGLGITEVNELFIKAGTNAKLLLMEVPMVF